MDFLTNLQEINIPQARASGHQTPIKAIGKGDKTPLTPNMKLSKLEEIAGKDALTQSKEFGSNDISVIDLDGNRNEKGKKNEDQISQSINNKH